MTSESTIHGDQAADGLHRDPRPSRAPARSEPADRALTPMGFWGVFTAGWLAYAGLLGTLLLGQRRPAWEVLTVAGANTVIHLAPALVLAWRRSDLLRPERSIVRTVVLHVLAGLGYGLVVTGLWFLFYGMTDPISGTTSGSAASTFVLRFVSALLLYGILVGFLMWSESMVRVQESRELAAREAMLRARAESEAIRARFNPHFVFNTLHSLILLVRAEPDEAERVIEDVAELIRYASVIQREGTEVVSLAQEIDVAERYVALEKLRFDRRLHVDWAIPDHLEGRSVPPFTLQTLLENAIKHGLSPRPEGGRIRITATVGEPVPSGARPRESAGAPMLLTVVDDGVGADPAEPTAARGRGLDLLRQRLEHLYGEDASLSFATEPGDGFRVTVRIPATPDRDGTSTKGHPPSRTRGAP